MRPITVLPNTEAPDSDFPGGRFKDTVGSNPGTRVNEAMTGDWAQFFYKIMEWAEIVPNNLPDSDYTVWQLFDALRSTVAKKFAKQFLSDGDGDVITITRAEIDAATGQTTIGSGRAISKSIPISGADNPLTDMSIKLYNLSGSTWTDITYRTGNLVRIDNVTGNVLVTINDNVYSQATFRIVIIG